jgi:hypothetical protein
MLTTIPSMCVKASGSFWDLAMRSSGSAGGGNRRIPVRLRLERVEEGA